MSDRYTERLSEYLDQELDASERVDFERHLTECAECAAILAELEQVVALACDLGEGDPGSIDPRATMR